MWLTFLWQNKGLVAAGLGVLLVLGLVITIKVQGARISSLNEKVEEETQAKEAAIDAHDQLVRDWERQKVAMERLQAIEQKREQDYAKLRKDLKAVLDGNPLWSRAPLPVGVVQSLRSLPEATPRSTPQPDPTRSGPAVRGPEQ